jgi:hypothetical protein
VTWSDNRNRGAYQGSEKYGVPKFAPARTTLESYVVLEIALDCFDESHNQLLGTTITPRLNKKPTIAGGLFVMG